MRSFTCLFFMALASVAAQTSAPKPPQANQRPAVVQPAPAQPSQEPKPQAVAPETVVATVEGRTLTAQEVDRLIAGLPPQLQQTAGKDRRQFIQQWAVFRKIADMAEKNKLDQKSPYKERLEYMRMQMLFNAQLDQASQDIPISPEDQKKTFETNPDRYTQARIKVIYIPFTAAATPTPPADATAKKTLTDPEAKAKADDLVKQIRGGADFVKLVKEHSGDPSSAAKDGDFGQPISRSDAIPEPIKTAIFALKPGEISDPVRQPNGYYIFRLEELKVQSYEGVKDAIFKELKEAAFKQWFAGQQKVDVKFENEAYFAPQSPAAPAMPGR